MTPIPLLLAALAAVTAVAALGPALKAPSQPAGLSDHDASTIRTEARHASAIPPMRLDIVVVSTTDSGPLPDWRDEVTVRWVTLFGVTYGKTTINGGDVRTELNETLLAGLWLVFVLAEVTLALMFFACLNIAERNQTTLPRG